MSDHDRQHGLTIPLQHFGFVNIYINTINIRDKSNFFLSGSVIQFPKFPALGKVVLEYEKRHNI
jgi:hypothetical protein